MQGEMLTPRGSWRIPVLRAGALGGRKPPPCLSLGCGCAETALCKHTKGLLSIRAVMLSSSAVIVASLSGVQFGVLSEREREIETGVWKGKGKRQGLVQLKQKFLWMFLQCWALGTAPFLLSHHLTITLPLSKACIRVPLPSAAFEPELSSTWGQRSRALPWVSGFQVCVWGRRGRLRSGRGQAADSSPRHAYARSTATGHRPHVPLAHH